LRTPSADIARSVGIAPNDHRHRNPSLLGLNTLMGW
jgi:hypothetical protein